MLTGEIASKSVTIRGITYASMRKAAAELGVSAAAVSKAAKSGRLDTVGTRTSPPKGPSLIDQMIEMAAKESDAAARIWGKEKGKPGAVPVTPVPTCKELTGPPPRPLTEHKLQITRKAVSEGLGRRAIAHKLGCGEKLAMRYIAAVKEEA